MSFVSENYDSGKFSFGKSLNFEILRGCLDILRGNLSKEGETFALKNKVRKFWVQVCYESRNFRPL